MGGFGRRQFVLKCQNDFIARLDTERGALQVVAISEAEEREAEDVYACAKREVDAQCAARAAQFGRRPNDAPGARAWAR